MKSTIVGPFRAQNIDSIIFLPKTVLVQKFNEEAVKVFKKEVDDALITGQQILPIYIDSYGGEVYSLLAMLDIIKGIKIPVATVCVGKAMSCGSVLLSSGTPGYRFLAENSTVMVHRVVGGSYGSPPDLYNRADEVSRLNDLILGILDKNSGQAPGYYAELIKNNNFADVYLTPYFASRHGIIDKIGTPSFDVKMECVINFNL